MTVPRSVADGLPEPPPAVGVRMEANGATADEAQASVTYRSLFAIPGARTVYAWVGVARIAYAVIPLAVLLFLSSGPGSFSRAGVALGAYGLVAGVLGPLRSRQVDRWGPRRALPALGVLYALSLLVVALTRAHGFGLTVLFMVVAGLTPPPAGPLGRTAWRLLVDGDQAKLNRAYALDAVTEDTIFLAGPLAAALLASRIGAQAVVIAFAVTMMVAAVGMASAVPMVRSAAAAVDASSISTKPLWRDGGFLAGLIPVTALGFLLSGTSLAGVAIALEAAGTSATGLPSAAISAGSVIGGLLYGRRQWSWGPYQQARVLVVAAALVLALAAAFHTVVAVFALLLAAAGLLVAPSFVCSYLVADLRSPEGSLEATSWVNAAYNSAAAIGSAVAGLLVVRTESWVTLLVVCGVAITLMAVSLLAQPGDQAGSAADTVRRLGAGGLE